MPECSYCGAKVDGEDAYHDHLASEHADELGPIDRRKLGLEGDDDAGFDVETVALWVVVLVPVAVVGYVLTGGLSGGGGPDGEGPYGLGSVHEHGTMEVVIDGQQVDFSQPQYQVGNTGVQAFHFENNKGRVWHVHAKGVTLQWALDTLGIDVTANSVTFDGTTYRDSDPGTNVTITVDGQPVVPSDHVLRGVGGTSNANQGDSVRIVVNVSD